MLSLSINLIYYIYPALIQSINPIKHIYLLSLFKDYPHYIYKKMMDINKLYDNEIPDEIINKIIYKHKGLSHPCSILINNAFNDMRDEILSSLRDEMAWGDDYINIPDKILWDDIINNNYEDDDIGSFIDNAYYYLLSPKRYNHIN
jgi:hypothetical protein